MEARVAKFGIGQVVTHRIYPFRGVIYNVDPMFANTEEWWRSIPAEVRPAKDQPFYHLYAENTESQYVAYVSEQNLVLDEFGRAGAPSAGRRDVRAHRQRRLSPAQQAHGELSHSCARCSRIPPAPRAGGSSCAAAARQGPRRGAGGRLLRGRRGRRPARRPAARRSCCCSSILRCSSALLLELLLQFLVLLLEHLRIDRRAVEGGRRSPSSAG